MITNIIIIVLIIIIIIYTLKILFNANLPKKDDYLPLYMNDNPVKCCILLTMYIGDDITRRSIYEDRVKKWLEQTNFEIFVVDSSGQYLNQKNKRLHQYSFKQEKQFARSNPTIYERDSILNAFEYFKNYFINFDIIFKVTGKYFIPNLENQLKYIPKDAELILQNRSDTYGQNTEIIGIKTSLIKPIISLLNSRNNFETTISKIKNNYKYYRLPSLKLNDYTKRGDSRILKELFIY